MVSAGLIRIIRPVTALLVTEALIRTVPTAPHAKITLTRIKLVMILVLPVTAVSLPLLPMVP